MQIAKQVYGLTTAENALIFFKNGEPAYLTKRFDYDKQGKKIAQEDFATLSSLSKENNGDSYRNQGSYQDIAIVMKKFVAAYSVEIEKYFEQVVFNYLFSNGDAHLKNFSLQQTINHDYLLSPAYDLLNTLIHLPKDSFFALSDGLFSDHYETKSFQSLGFYAYDDFYEFGIKIGLLEKRLKRILDKYRADNHKTNNLIEVSFLGEEAKVFYKQHYLERLKMLSNSFSKRI
jgi:serine/threonine-protein kinase HipA